MSASSPGAGRDGAREGERLGAGTVRLVSETSSARGEREHGVVLTFDAGKGRRGSMASGEEEDGDERRWGGDPARKRSGKAASGGGEVQRRRGIKVGEVALVDGEARSKGNGAPGSGAGVDDDGEGGCSNAAGGGQAGEAAAPWPSAEQRMARGAPLLGMMCACCVVAAGEGDEGIVGEWGVI